MIYDTPKIGCCLIFLFYISKNFLRQLQLKKGERNVYEVIFVVNVDLLSPCSDFLLGVKVVACQICRSRSYAFLSFIYSLFLVYMQRELCTCPHFITLLQKLCLKNCSPLY